MNDGGNERERDVKLGKERDGVRLGVWVGRWITRGRRRSETCHGLRRERRWGLEFGERRGCRGGMTNSGQGREIDVARVVVGLSRRPSRLWLIF